MYLKLRIGVQQNGGPTKLIQNWQSWMKHDETKIWPPHLNCEKVRKQGPPPWFCCAYTDMLHVQSRCLWKTKDSSHFGIQCVGDLSKWLGPWQGANDIWRDQTVSRSRSTLQLSWGCQHVGCEYQGTSSAQASMKNTQVKLYLLARHVYFCNGGAVWSGLAPSIFASPGLRVSCCNAVVL